MSAYILRQLFSLQKKQTKVTVWKCKIQLPVAEYAHTVVSCNHARLAECFLNKDSNIYTDHTINKLIN